MKLITHTLLFLSAILFATVALWSIVFYFQLVHQVKISVDEGFANYKIVIIDKVKDGSPIIQHETPPGKQLPD